MLSAHCVSTTSGVILDVDRAFCTLVQRNERSLIGASYKTITLPDDIAKSSKMLRSMTARGAPSTLQKRYRRPDGTVAHASLLVTMARERDRLLATVTWERCPAEDASPFGLWRAALRLQRLYETRRQEFGEELFGDHLGVILLEVYLAEAEGRIATQATISNAASVSAPMVGRWIKVLCQYGLLQADRDLTDVIHLSHAGLMKIERTLRAFDGEPARNMITLPREM
ncbi:MULTISPECIES: PAS domain-containing protein [Sphingomonas]|uniref:PAS domain-containing protein n=1 Tax=Sphingomonas TaxID=13687 RepID=UPI000DD5DEF5|nr:MULTISPECIES: PAS domain-containing protein [Sphingomonas]